MPSQLKTLEPKIALGDKLVEVGVLSWGGFKTVLEEFTKANLPLPKLAVDKLGAAFAEIQASNAAAPGSGATTGAGGQQANARLYELLAALVTDNLPTLSSWLVAHPPIVSALVRESSNLSAEETDQLTSGELLRVARAAWSALVSDGFFTEAAGFFGDLVGVRPTNPPTSSQGPSADPATGRAAPNDSTSP